MAQIQENKYEPDDGMVDLEFTEEATEVEVSEGPKQFLDPEASEAPEIEAVEEEVDPEVEEYSSSVQKRIDRLTKKMRQAERDREEAIRFAQQQKQEAEQTKQKMQQLDQGYMQEYGGRISVEQQQAEDALRRAVDSGDTDATVEAQRKMTQLAVAQERYNSAKSQQEQYVQQQQQQEQQPQPQPQPQPQQAPDPKAEKWAEKNKWFGQDEAMTFAAFGLHKKMVEEEGFDPLSDEYYSELNTRIQTSFPHKFNGASKKTAQTVAGVSRNTGNGRTNRKVRLTPSQVTIAKRLGVPLEEYAKYVKE
tara:strand:+ start:384 stop:1301 length:918 start_codon:yes stop_codon:yes gene_type:complete